MSSFAKAQVDAFGNRVYIVSPQQEGGSSSRDGRSPDRFSIPIASGTAATLLQQHVRAENPHTQYALRSEIALLAPPPVSGGSNPGGIDTQVQFNDGGSTLGGDSGFTYNKTSNTLTIDNLVAAVKMLVPSAVPLSNTAAGTTGEITWDATYLYQCVATNVWKRTAWAETSWDSTGGFIHLLWGCLY